MFSSHSELKNKTKQNKARACIFGFQDFQTETRVWVRIDTTASEDLFFSNGECKGKY